MEGKRGIRIDISIATNNKAAPPDLKEWVADNVLAKFILEAVEVTDTAAPDMSGVVSSSNNIWAVHLLLGYWHL